MNFLQMRETVSTNIFDFVASAFTVDEVGVYVNQALHHIESQIAVVDRHLMLTQFESEPINNTANAHWMVVTLDPPQPKARRIVSAQRIDDGITSDDISLEIISFKDAEHEATGSALAKPKVFLYNQDIGLVRPEEDGNTVVRIHYVQVLPDMFLNTDTPGQASGIPLGQINALPAQYHHLITSYATLLALAAENAPIEQWTGLYAEQAAAAGLDVNLRGQTQENKRVNLR